MSIGKFMVSLEIPAGCDQDDIADYIQKAVRSWCGQDHDDPIYYLDKDSVKVRVARESHEDLVVICASKIGDGSIYDYTFRRANGLMVRVHADSELANEGDKVRLIIDNMNERPPT